MMWKGSQGIVLTLQVLIWVLRFAGRLEVSDQVLGQLGLAMMLKGDRVATQTQNAAT